VIRVMIVDDNPVIRRGVTSLLQDADDIEVVSEAGDGREAIRVAGESHPDVVLLDVQMPVMDGVAAAPALAQRAKVMMLTYTDQEERVVSAIRAGASGYLVHGQFDADELEDRIRGLAAGDTVLSPNVVGTVFGALQRTTGSAQDLSGPATLTGREQEIMDLVSQGLTNGQIADRFFLSEKTVKNHVNHIYGKLEARNRVQATAIWLGTANRGPRR
jgi:DNA-binding NarL/FixJ family response regulator